MITNLKAACAAMKRQQLLRRGKILDGADLFWHRRKVYRLLVAIYWDAYVDTRSCPKRRQPLLEKMWREACELIREDMSVKEALDYAFSMKASLSTEQRAHPTRRVQPPLFRLN